MERMTDAEWHRMVARARAAGAAAGETSLPDLFGRAAVAYITGDWDDVGELLFSDDARKLYATLHQQSRATYRGDARQKRRAENGLQSLIDIADSYDSHGRENALAAWLAKSATARGAGRARHQLAKRIAGVDAATQGTGAYD